MKKLYLQTTAFSAILVLLVTSVGFAQQSQAPDEGATGPGGSAAPGGVRLRIKEMARDVAGGRSEYAGIEKFEKVAAKLVESMKQGRYESSDFSEAWTEKLGTETDFSTGVQRLYEPVLTRYGTIKRLGRGRVVAPERAVFTAFFAGGPPLEMGISLDEKDKIVEWTLAPRGQGRAGTAPGVGVAVSVDDANQADSNELGESRDELRRLELRARQEERQWGDGATPKTELLEAANGVATAELKFIRDVAVEEGAEKTVAAIDAVLARRQQRVASMAEKVSEQLREERMRQSEERRSRRVGETSRSRDRDRDSRRSRDRRPSSEED